MEALRGFDANALAHPLLQGLRAGAHSRTRAPETGRDDTAVRESREQRLVVSKQPSVERAERGSDSPTATTESAYSLRYRGSARTALFIETQEGDTVRLKIKATESLKVDAASLAEGDRLVSSVEMKNRSRSQISLVVNGDLNADELASIQKVVNQASTLAGEFFNGDLQTAFNAASGLSFNGEQLARVGLKMRMTQQLTYSERSVRNVLAHPPAAREPMARPEPAPVTPTRVAPSSTPTPAASRVTSEAPDVAPAATPAPISTAAASGSTTAISTQLAANDSRSPAGTDPLDAMQNILDVISDFLARLADFFDQIQAEADAANDSDEEGQVTVSTTLKIKIVESVLVSASELAAAQTVSESPRDAVEASDDDDRDHDDDDAVPALIAETVEAMAARHQEPVSATA